MTAGRLAGKIAIVTGSGGGIGRGCALMFARQGAMVMGCDIRPDAAQETLDLAAREGLPMESLHPCDLTAPADVQRLINATIARFGRIDILVNAGAFGAFAFIEEMDFDSHWRRTLSGELDVVFLACKAAWPHLKQNGGAIINFASANAYMALPGSGALAHCAGKGGVLAMTRQLAMEGGAYKIRANTISPGMTLTDATAPVLEQPGFKENVLDRMMIKQIGMPEDIAWCAVYLASDESRWVTAADISVDGGATAL